VAGLNPRVEIGQAAERARRGSSRSAARVTNWKRKGRGGTPGFCGSSLPSCNQINAVVGKGQSRTGAVALEANADRGRKAAEATIHHRGRRTPEPASGMARRDLFLAKARWLAHLPKRDLAFVPLCRHWALTGGYSLDAFGCLACRLRAGLGRGNGNDQPAMCRPDYRKACLIHYRYRSWTALGSQHSPRVSRRRDLG